MLNLRRDFISPRGVPIADRVFAALAPRRAGLLLALVCGCVAVVGFFVLRDSRAVIGEAQQIYTTSIQGLQQIGELQYQAQETRRATLYALTTTDSNLQVVYADQTREADHRVREGIREYARQAHSLTSQTLATRLSHDWSDYLAVRDEVLASILEGSTREAVTLDLRLGVPSFERVRRDLQEVKAGYAQDASRMQSDLAALSRRSSRKLAGILAFTFLLSMVAVWAIQRSRMLSHMQLAELQMHFVASVSHELRTPLAVIRSAADNLADGIVRDQAAAKRYGGIVQRQGRSMSDLIDQILLFASTEDREARYTLQPIQVEELLHAVRAQMEPLLQAAGRMVVIQSAQALPSVRGDRAALSQCLQNLIGNAIKYGGDQEPIAVRTCLSCGRASQPQHIEIAVTDRGMGIESSELPRIFEPFYRSPRVVAAQIHGTGLGLALAKRMTESMGGRLTVESQPSQGSTFTLHLQIAKGEDALPVVLADPASVSRL